MKKKGFAVFLVVLMAAALTACTQSDTQENAGSAVSGSSGGQVSGQGSVSGSDGVSAEADGSGEGVSGGDVSGSVTGGTGAEGTAQTGTEGAAAEGGYEEAISYEEDGEEETSSEEEENYSEDELDGLSEESEAASGTDWAGTYVSDEGETLTLTVVDETNIAFSFANAGISGTAELDGTQAIYHGDDYHVVVFESVAGAINVSVLSEEDYDTSESPLNGLYVSE